MKICFTVWLLSFAVGCSVNNSAKTDGVQNRNTDTLHLASKAPDSTPTVENRNINNTIVDNRSTKSLDCNEPSGYSLVVVTDPDRNAQNSGTVPRILKVVAGDETKAVIKIPTDSDANNFSLSSVEKTEEGFEITIEYGVRHYYRKQFDFICKGGEFYLHIVKVESFDEGDSESRKNWDKKEIKVRPNLPVEKFSIFDYLTN